MRLTKNRQRLGICQKACAALGMETWGCSDHGLLSHPSPPREERGPPHGARRMSINTQWQWGRDVFRSNDSTFQRF